MKRFFSVCVKNYGCGVFLFYTYIPEKQIPLIEKKILKKWEPKFNHDDGYRKISCEEILSSLKNLTGYEFKPFEGPNVSVTFGQTEIEGISSISL